MKAKITIRIAAILLVIILATGQARSQQYAIPQMTGKSISYTYKIFQAPNKNYGFDIFKEGRIILHQPACAAASGSYITALSKKEDAEKAAIFAIEKIKRGQPFELTQDELKKLLATDPLKTTTENH